MSVTFSIEENREYCESHGLKSWASYRCDCDEYGASNPECEWCHGTGVVRYPEYPFEMNVANGNFTWIMDKLGFTGQEDKISGQALRKALASFKPVELLRDSEQLDADVPGPMVICCGVTQEQAARYCKVLWEIADEAERRESFVVWG